MKLEINENEVFSQPDVSRLAFSGVNLTLTITKIKISFD